MNRRRFLFALAALPAALLVPKLPESLKAWRYRYKYGVPNQWDEHFRSVVLNESVTQAELDAVLTHTLSKSFVDVQWEIEAAYERARKATGQMGNTHVISDRYAELT